MFVHCTELLTGIVVFFATNRVAWMLTREIPPLFEEPEPPPQPAAIAKHTTKDSAAPALTMAMSSNIDLVSKKKIPRPGSRESCRDNE